MCYAYNKIVSCIYVDISKEMIEDAGINEMLDAAKKDNEYQKAADLI